MILFKFLSLFCLLTLKTFEWVKSGIGGSASILRSEKLSATQCLCQTHPFLFLAFVYCLAGSLPFLMTVYSSCSLILISSPLLF